MVNGLNMGPRNDPTGQDNQLSAQPAEPNEQKTVIDIKQEPSFKKSAETVFNVFNAADDKIKNPYRLKSIDELYQPNHSQELLRRLHTPKSFLNERLNNLDLATAYAIICEANHNKATNDLSENQSSKQLRRQAWELSMLELKSLDLTNKEIARLSQSRDSQDIKKAIAASAAHKYYQYYEELDSNIQSQTNPVTSIQAIEASNKTAEGSIPAASEPQISNIPTQPEPFILNEQDIPIDHRDIDEIMRERLISGDKKEIAWIPDAFTKEEYDKWRAKIDKVKLLSTDTKQEIQTKVDEFFLLWEQVLTANQEDHLTPKILPKILIPALFEQSFKFFDPKVSTAQQQELAVKQIDSLTTHFESGEMHNILLGIWGFWLDPSRANSDNTTTKEDNIRTSIKAQYSELLKSDHYNITDERDILNANIGLNKKLPFLATKIPDWNDYATTRTPSEALHSTEPNQIADFIEDARYFAQQYELDSNNVKVSKPENWQLEPLSDHIKIQELDNTEPGQTEAKNTGQYMITHDRVLVFEHDRLPDLAEEPRLIITQNNVLIAKNRKKNVAVDPLPSIILDNFVSDMRMARKGFKIPSGAPGEQIRRDFVVNFIEKLLDKESLLRQAISSSLTHIEANNLEELLDKYATLKPENLYLGAAIRIN